MKTEKLFYMHDEISWIFDILCMDSFLRRFYDEHLPTVSTEQLVVHYKAFIEIFIFQEPT